MLIFLKHHGLVALPITKDFSIPPVIKPQRQSFPQEYFSPFNPPPPPPQLCFLTICNILWFVSSHNLRQFGNPICYSFLINITRFTTDFIKHNLMPLFATF
jgi:hypothetical protein